MCVADFHRLIFGVYYGLEATFLKKQNFQCFPYKALKF